MHTSTNEQVLQAESIRKLFTISKARLPERINKEDVLVVGFADECYVRQSAEFFASFADFLRSIGDTSFFFLWLDASSEDAVGACGLSLHSVSADMGETNFVRLQSHIADDVLAGEAWFVSSQSGQWAIFGEQYESELAVFLARDLGIARKMHSAFEGVLSDARKAATEMGDPSETEEGELFASRLRTNYPQLLGVRVTS